MKRGRVVGEVWATRKVDGLKGRRLKLIVEHPQPSAATAEDLARAPLTVAIDTLDAKSGQEVLLAYGSGARNVITDSAPQNRQVLCDAAIALLIES